MNNYIPITICIFINISMNIKNNINVGIEKYLHRKNIHSLVLKHL